MKKQSYLPLLIITALFTVCIICVLSYRHMSSVPQVDSSNTTAVNNTITASGRININVASAEHLTLLPKIGDTLAQRIVDYREENGPYKCIDDLTNVKGIGETTLDAIRTYISIGD